MSSGIIVLAPPWPRSGTGNVIAAQTAAHARRGNRVFLLLTPLDRSHRPNRSEFWRDAVAAMAFPGVETVTYPRAESGSVRSYCDWVLAGRDDAIAISARYAAGAALPGELAEFVASARIDLIHANHVFSMHLARRIAGLVERRQGRRPRIILDTHDVQSDAFASRRCRNPHSRRPDAHDDLLKTELTLCALADVLVHLTQADLDFFSRRLPGNHHEVILPTLHPTSEAQLVCRRGARRQAGFDFIYVGNHHDANLATVRWLLREVFPFAGRDVHERIRIIGAIGDLLRSRDPALFRRHEHLFVGEMPSIVDFYSAAKAILAPAAAGTGTSIKLIEALCIGKPILTTGLALRGLPAGVMTGEDIHVHDTAADFADAMTRLSAPVSPASAASLANAALYDRLFSNQRYFAALDDALDGKSRRGSTGVPAGRIGDPHGLQTAAQFCE